MSTSGHCPSANQLEEYLLGRTTDAVALALEQHLSGCPSCQEALPSVLAEDELVMEFRQEARRTAPEDEVLDGLRSCLRRLSMPQTSITRDTPPPPGSMPTVTPGFSDEADILATMLTPPRQPGELGWLGAYRVLKVLGAGGMGLVFEAEDPSLKRRIALKAMKPTLAASRAARQRFLREAQLIASLHHDHIVTIHQVGEDRGVPFLAMPLLPGESLDSRLRRENRLPVAEVLRIGREVAEGLAAAHGCGLIHRDIKPANLWLEAPNGRVKILDFGLARLLHTEEQLTPSGLILGTPAFMAPEQTAGSIDHRADLFSLGSVLYRMATGQPAFAGATPFEIIGQIALGTPRPPAEHNPELPAALVNLILWLLAKEPGGRPASATAAAEAIRAMEKGAAEDTTVIQAPSHTGPLARPVRPAKSIHRSVDPRRRRLWHALGERGRWVAMAMLLLVGAPLGALIYIAHGPGSATKGLANRDAEYAQRATREGERRAAQGELLVDPGQTRPVPTPATAKLSQVQGEGMDSLAGALKKILKSHNSSAIAVGRFTGSGKDTLTGPIIRHLLIKNLRALGVGVEDNAKLRVQGTFVYFGLLADDEDGKAVSAQNVVYVQATVHRAVWVSIHWVWRKAPDEFRTYISDPEVTALRSVCQQVRRFARKIKASMAGLREGAIDVGEFTGPPTPATGAGPAIRQLLVEALTAEGVNVKQGAALYAKGEYLFVEDDKGGNRTFPRVVTVVRNKKDETVVSLQADLNGGIASLNLLEQVFQGDGAGTVRQRPAKNEEPPGR
jgi:serine/threonine protein kinase